MRKVCWDDTRAEGWWVRFSCQAEEIMDGEEEVEQRREREEEGEMKWCRHECRLHLKQAHEGVICCSY